MTPVRERTVTLLDSTTAPPSDSGLVYRWNGYEETAERRSLLAYCDRNAERLRRDYCGWIYDLGHSRIDGQPLVERFHFGDGLSFWWLTLLVEQSPWKSPSINDAIRLLALDEIVRESRPSQFRLLSSDDRLHAVCEDLCGRLAIRYERVRPADEAARPWNVTALVGSLPQTVRGFASLLRYCWRRWPLREAASPAWHAGDRSVLICSYFDNLDIQAANERRFFSRFWTDLPGFLGRLGYRINWLQIFIPHAAIPSSDSALRLTRGFNERPADEGFHAFLESYLSARIVLRVLSRWLRLLVASWPTREIREAFRPAGRQVTLWPVMSEHWYASTQGSSSISGLLWIELFNTALRAMPHQRWGLYLCENLAWERALIHYWRKHGHGRLVGVPHSAVSFWDMRHICDPRIFVVPSPYPLPRPDQIAVNGPAAWQALVAGNHPRTTLVECEALRYNYLKDLVNGGKPARNGGSIRVLILGEILRSGTTKMLRMLEEMTVKTPLSASFTLKPHPNCPVEPNEFPSLKLTLSTAPLSAILRDFDVACASNSTTAAVDAYLAGVPVIVVLDDTKLNQSPLRGRRGVGFVSTAEELAQALEGKDSLGTPDDCEFFFLDPTLPRWSRIGPPIMQ